MACVLIVEDNNVSARILSGILEREKHTCIQAVDAEEGMVRLNQTVVVDLIILDNHLGKEYGWEFLNQVRKSFLFAPVPVTVYTATSDRDSVLRYIELGVQNILTKPYRPPAVLGEVQKALEAPWRDRFFEPEAHVCRRLSFTPEAYYKHLNDVADELHASARDLKQWLGTNNDARFYNRLEGLRSNATNLGIAIIKRTCDRITKDYQAADWPQAVHAINVLPQIGRLLEARFRAFFNIPEVAAATPAPAAEAPKKQAPKPVGEIWDSTLVRQTATAPFHRFFEDLKILARRDRHASRDTEAQLLNGKAPDSVRRLMDQVARHFSEDGQDLDGLVEAVGKHDGLGATLEAMLRREEEKLPDSLGIKECVRMLGQGRVGSVLVVTEWLNLARETENPLDLRRLAAEHLLTAFLARVLTRRMESIRNVELSCLACRVGHWALALAHPGLFGLYLQLEEAGAAPADAGIELFGFGPAEFAARVLEKAKASPDFALVARFDRRPGEMTSGTARRTAAFVELAVVLAQYALSTGRPDDDSARKAFIDSRAWKVLRDESINLPVEPAVLLKHLEAACHQAKAEVTSILNLK